MNTGKQLIIIEKYEDFSNYIYLVLQNIPRKHGILKERAINLIFKQVELFYTAIKSNQKSKLYEKEFELWKIRTQLAYR